MKCLLNLIGGALCRATGPLQLSHGHAMASAVSVRSATASLWFPVAILPMVASQIVRLQQSDPAAWIFWDYAGRLSALAVLASIPLARKIAFRRERLQIYLWHAAIWVVGIVLVDHYLCGWIRRTINSALPTTVLGHYPELHGWLRLLDLTFGIALVAYSEEVVFRRCASCFFRTYVNNDWLLVIFTSILFGAYHWWAGVGNIAEAVLIGLLLMLFYLRSVALWPVVLAHYLTDVIDFV
jgi:hypothetical protein